MIDELRQVVSTKGTLKALAASAVSSGIERALGLPLLKRLYLETARRPEPLFADRALAVLGVQTEAVGNVDAIPSTGPLIVVANHPTGALDGLVMLSLLARRRGDVRLLANHVLASIPDLRDDLILVDPFGGKDAVSRNRRPLREAMRWVRDGRCLCLFPAGVVSHLHREKATGRWQVADPAWHQSLDRLVQATGAPVVSCFIEGRNSALFQLAGLVHPRLRTLLLPRELLNKRRTRVTVHVGPVAAPRTPVLDGWSAEAAEIAPLLKTQQLVTSGAFTVFWTEPSQAPRLLGRIAVERELAFRAVGEGTGRDRDRDSFDDRYVHLCAWDHTQQALVGAYRVGILDSSASTSTSTLDTLYTSTLFHFDRQLNDLLAPAMELGRAFVRAPYQKHHAALMALWMGIGRLVLTRPGTRYLFGAVSIPATYSPAARALMIAFLRRHAMHHQFARLTTPRNPIPAIDGAAAAAQIPATVDIDALDVQVRALDPEGKGVPVLLRHYLRLGARALAFNVDANFNDALDVLVAVDLPNAPAALLRRYMGSDDARAYIELHADGRARERERAA